MLPLQGELALRQAQVEKLSAVGQCVLQTLDPLRSKCSAQLRELLVNARLHCIWHHPAVGGLEMLSATSSSCFEYWRAAGNSRAALHA